MKSLACAVLFCLLSTITATQIISQPMVEVYSRKPGFHGEINHLICHVSGFQQPDINIDLLKNGAVIPDAVQTDLAFDQKWQFHITKSVAFTPKSNEEYTCIVNHMGNVKKHIWEADM